MLRMTVDQAAKALDVTPKTIRAWIRDDGLPTVTAGAKGPGRGAIIDGARLPGWLDRFHGTRGTTWAEVLARSFPNRNPLRDITDTVRLGVLSILGKTLAEWAVHPENFGRLDYRQDGLTPEQARAVAYRVWAACRLAIDVYHADHLEKHIEESVGADLDGWFSFLTRGDFETPAKETSGPIPDAILEIMPAADRELLEKAFKSKRRQRGKG